MDVGRLIKATEWEWESAKSLLRRASAVTGVSNRTLLKSAPRRLRNTAATVAVFGGGKLSVRRGVHILATMLAAGCGGSSHKRRGEIVGAACAA